MLTVQIAEEPTQQGIDEHPAIISRGIARADESAFGGQADARPELVDPALFRRHHLGRRAEHRR